MNKELLTTKEAAYYLGVSSGHLRLSRHTGEIFKGISTPQYILFNKAIRYKIQVLDRWIAENGVVTNNIAHSRMGE